MKKAGRVYISRKVFFSAAHRMFNPELSDEENLRLYGKCSNPGGHGHNYVVEVTVRGIPDERTGVVINLDDLKKLLDWEIIDRFDHKDLSSGVDVLEGSVISMETLVRVIWDLLDPKITDAELYEVRIWETDTNCAWYRGGE